MFKRREKESEFGMSHGQGIIGMDHRRVFQFAVRIQARGNIDTDHFIGGGVDVPDQVEPYPVRRTVDPVSTNRIDNNRRRFDSWITLYGPVVLERHMLKVW